MSILDLYNNPPKEGRQIRFANGQVPAAGADYQAYQRNDQASLRNSKLHADSSSPGNEVAGYSCGGGTGDLVLHLSRRYHRWKETRLLPRLPFGLPEGLAH